MRLVYIDTKRDNELKTVSCGNRDAIPKVLAKKGINSVDYAGDVVQYVYIDQDGNETSGWLDFRVS